MKTNYFSIIFLILVFFTACTSTNVEKENEATFVVKEKTEETTKNELLTQPNLSKEDLKKIKYEDLETDLQGGIINVKIDDEDFAEDDYIFETLRNENVIDYDPNLKTVNIMVANYQNTNTNLVITAIGDKKGTFPIISSSERSASVTFYYNNGLSNQGGALKEGTLNIDIFDEEKGYARGRIEGKTEKGSPIKATFSVYSK
jgi:PBP1b-binding outer membrane lipoprotein LpoB